MNRTLKTFFLLLFVSSVSFVYAQEADEKDIVKGGKGVTDAAKDGKAGVKFIETVVRSSNEGSVWINF